MSSTTFRAITTRYKGYNFRSRLEARWAVFFDHLGIRWDYEPEGFELGNGLRYLPDFWLPDYKLWIEVKPAEADAAAKEKAWRLAESSNHPVYVTNGMPDEFGSLFITFKGDWLHRWEYPVSFMWDKSPIILYLRDGEADEETVSNFMIRDQEFGAIKCYLGAPPKSHLKHPALYSKKQNAALEAARGARFEFGAKGGV